MPKTSSQENYDAVAKTLHWLIALAIIAMLVIGWLMVYLPKSNPYKFPLFQWHKSIGITILLLSFVRLGWRFGHPTPPLPVETPRWEVISARSVQALFYVLMVGMPLVGWALVSMSPLHIPTMLYGLIELPNMPVLPDLENKHEIHEVLGYTHYVGACILVGLLVLHVGAALKHHWFDRDSVLLSMTPTPFTKFLMCLRGQKPNG